jgi:hypothetical protein
MSGYYPCPTTKDEHRWTEGGPRDAGHYHCAACQVCLSVSYLIHQERKGRARVAELESKLVSETESYRRALSDEYAKREALDARVAELETAIRRHIAAREGESGERPDITIAALYRIVKPATPSVSEEQASFDRLGLKPEVVAALKEVEAIRRDPSDASPCCTRCNGTGMCPSVRGSRVVPGEMMSCPCEFSRRARLIEQRPNDVTPDRVTIDRGTASQEEVNAAIRKAVETGTSLTVELNGIARMQIAARKPVEGYDDDDQRVNDVTPPGYDHGITCPRPACAAQTKALDARKAAASFIEEWLPGDEEILGPLAEELSDAYNAGRRDALRLDNPKGKDPAATLEKLAADTLYRAQMVTDDSDRADGEAQDDEIDRLEYEAAIIERCANAIRGVVRSDYPNSAAVDWSRMTGEETARAVRSRPVILQEWQSWGFASGHSRHEMTPIARDGGSRSVSVQPSTEQGVWIIRGLDGYKKSQEATTEAEAMRLADEGAIAAGWKLLGRSFAQRIDSVPPHPPGAKCEACDDTTAQDLETAKGGDRG